MLKLALQSLWARRLTAGLALPARRHQRHPAARGGAGAQSGTGQLRQHRLGHRSHRRRPLRPGEPAALFGVSHRQPHQQRGLGLLPGHQARPGPGPSPSPWRLLGVSRARHQWGSTSPAWYGQQQALVPAKVAPSKTPFEVVLGGPGGRKARLSPGSIHRHRPWRRQHLVQPARQHAVQGGGILAPTGTPIDRTIPRAAGGHKRRSIWAGTPVVMQQERDPGTGDGAGSHPKTIPPSWWG